MKEKRNITIILALTVLLAIIAINLKSSWLLTLNHTVNQWIPLIQVGFFVEIAKIISFVFQPAGGSIILILVVAIYLFFTKRQKDSIILLAVTGMGSIVGYLLKNIFMVARPANALIHETDFAFPSGHSFISVLLLVLSVYYLTKNWKKSSRNFAIALAVIGSAIIAFSRVYLNVHWLSDVVGGLILGYIFFVLAFVFEELTKKEPFKKILDNLFKERLIFPN